MRKSPKSRIFALFLALVMAFTTVSSIQFNVFADELSGYMYEDLTWFGNGSLTNDFSTTTPAALTVNVFPSDASASPGDIVQFYAEVEYLYGEVPQDVWWGAFGNHSMVTSITSEGLLVIAEDETSHSLQIVATLVGDREVYGVTILNMIRPEIDITDRFLDSSFLSAILEIIGIPENESVYLSDVANITFLDVSNREITSLAGIEYFVSLATLLAVENYLTDLNISTITDLTWLDVRLNNMESPYNVVGWQNTELMLGVNFLFDPQRSDVLDLIPQVGGYSGDNITWTLNLDAGLLEIRGSGAMWNWTELEPAPWYYHREAIQSVFVHNGISSIGARAFAGLSNLTIAHIADTVTNVGMDAYEGTESLRQIRIFYTAQGFVAFTGPTIPAPGWDLLFGGFNLTSGNEFRRAHINTAIIRNDSSPEAVAALYALNSLGNQVRSYGGNSRTEFASASHTSFQSMAETLGSTLRVGARGEVSGIFKKLSASANYSFTRDASQNSMFSRAHENFFFATEVTRSVGQQRVPSTNVLHNQHDIIWEALNPQFRRDILSTNFNDVHQANHFFSQWGTHIITSYSFGGRAEYHISISRVTEGAEESIASRITHEGGGRIGIPGIFGATASTTYETAQEAHTRFDAHNYHISQHGRIAGGSHGSGTLLNAMSTGEFSDMDTWLDSISANEPWNTEILIDGNLGFVGIWELLPPEETHRRALMEHAFLDRLTNDQRQFFTDFIHSTVRISQPTLERPTLYQNATIVSTPAQFAAIRNNPNGNFILANDIDLTGTPQSNWTSFAFSGRLEGNGNTVRGVNLIDPNFGLFTTINSGGHVRNLRIEYDSRATPNNGGVAVVNNGTIHNVVTGTGTAYTVTTIPSGNWTAPSAIVVVLDFRTTVDRNATRAITIPVTVDTVIFRGSLGLTFSNLRIIVPGGTHVVLEDFSFDAPANAYAIQFNSTTAVASSPRIISMGTSNTIRSAATSNSPVIRASGHLGIFGSANLTVTHSGAGTTEGNPDAISVAQSLTIGMRGASLTATGGSGRAGDAGDDRSQTEHFATSGSDGVAGVRPPGSDGDAGVSGSTVRAQDGGNGFNGGRGGHAISANSASIPYNAIVNLTGGDGGRGGNGGRGARGQSGGHGGNGALFIDMGSRSGSGGRGGNGQPGGNGGRGGDGGIGGSPLNLFTSTFHASRYAQLAFIAGFGGDGGIGGLGGMGGNGGRGGNRATGGWSQQLWGTLGNGGNGGRGGDSGRGGDGAYDGSLVPVGRPTPTFGGFGGSSMRINLFDDSFLIGHPSNPQVGGRPGSPGGGGICTVLAQIGNTGNTGGNGAIGANGTSRGGTPQERDFARRYNRMPTATLATTFDDTFDIAALAGSMSDIIALNAGTGYWANHRLIIERLDNHPPRLEQSRDAAFDARGFRVYHLNTNGTRTHVPEPNFRFDFSQDGVTLVTVTHIRLGIQYVRHIPIRVVAPYQVNMAFRYPIENARHLTYLYIGDNFSPSGFAIEIFYSDGTMRVIPHNDNSFDVTVPPDISTRAGNHTVHVRHALGNWSYTVQTFEDRIVDIQLVAPLSPWLMEQRGGQPFNSTGMRFRLVYSSGLNREVGSGAGTGIIFIPSILPDTPVEIPQFVVTVNAGLVTRELSPIRVVPDPISHINILGGLVTQYYEGQYFDTSNLQLELFRPETGNHVPVDRSFIQVNPPRALNLSDDMVWIHVHHPVFGTWTRTENIIVRAVAVDNFPPVITTDELEVGTVGVAYETIVEAEGTQPITWGITAGGLPAGLVLNGNVISGTPLAYGTFNFTINAQNAFGYDTQEFTLIINPPRPVITTETLPSGFVGDVYNAEIVATGGGVITWSIVGGNLPDGLTLSDNGEIFGIALEAGLFAFVVRASGLVGYDERGFTINIELPGTSIFLADAFAIGGRTARVPVRITDNPGFDLFTTEIIFDSPLITTPISIESGNVLNFNHWLAGGSINGGVVNIHVDAHNQNIGVSDGTIVEVEIEVSNSAVAGNLYGVRINTTDNLPRLRTVNGFFNEVRVQSIYANIEIVIPGDITGTGARTLQDVDLTLQHLVELQPLSERGIVAADFDGDGRITARDANIIQRTVAGMSTPFALASPMNLSAPVNISVGAVEGTAGDIVRVPVNISDNQGISSLHFEIQYNNEVLMPIGYELGNVRMNMYRINLHGSSGVLLAGTSTFNNPQNGLLAYIIFEVNENARDGVAYVNLRVSDLGNVDGFIINDGAEIVEGGVIVGDYIPELRIFGTVSSFMPNIETTLQLMQNDEIIATTTIAPESGRGQVEQSFAFYGVGSGTYSLRISKPGHLTVTVTNIVVDSQNVNLTQIISRSIDLPAGDFNGDGRIDFADRTLVQQNLNRLLQQIPEHLHILDLDGSGRVDMADMQIVTLNMNRFANGELRTVIDIAS